MLGKLLKYDIKSFRQLMIPAYIMLGLFALADMIAELLSDKYPTSATINAIAMCTFGALILGMVVLCVAIVIIAILQFRNNLLKDEGYLMHTLPVSANSLVLSKMLTVIIWTVVSVGVFYLLFALASRDIAWISDLYRGMMADIDGKEGRTFLAMMLLVVLISCLAQLCQIYASLSLGYRVKGMNKDIASIAVYIGFYILQQIIGVVILIVVGLSHFQSLAIMLAEPNPPFGVMIAVYVAEALVEVAVAAVFYFLSVNSLGKHLNLE